MVEILKLANLTKKFKEHVVINNVSLEFNEGEIFTLMGQSGVGKSVLLRMINGLVKPNSGQIIYNGVDITDYNEMQWVGIRKEIGMLFQMGALFDSLNVYENVAFQLREHLKLDEKEIKERVSSFLNDVGLKDIEHLYPAELSGGMQKRVALARTIALKPKILLYDEPVTGLDPITSSIIAKLIKDINKKRNITSIIISHDVKNALSISDRVGILYRGKLMAVENADKVSSSKDPFIKQFIKGEIRGPIEVFLEEE